MKQIKVHKASYLQITKWWLYCRGSLGDIATSHMEEDYERNKRTMARQYRAPR